MKLKLGPPRSDVQVLRLVRRLSQEKLAALAGIDRCNLIAIETGRRFPRRKTIIRLATALGVTPAEYATALVSSW